MGESQVIEQPGSTAAAPSNWAGGHAGWPNHAPQARLEPGFLAFVGLWLFVGLVSAYDGYLTVRYQHMLHSLEANPVGRWIMDLDDGRVFNKEYGYVVENRRVATFLGLKFAGTVLSLGIMLVVHRYKARLGMLVSGIIAGLQGALAVYLSCF
jgi:hypothetical protein